jgi:taurine dioxygenase
VTLLARKAGSDQIEVIPLNPALGAEIRGVDLADISPAQFDKIFQAYLAHQVLLVRGQKLSDPQLIELGRKFGELEPPGVSITGKPFLEQHPEILVISNIVDNGVPQGNLGAGEAVWHTDMSYREVPVSTAILYSLEIPPTGGDTYFANQYLAYETLPEQLKKRIDGRVLVHDETYNSAGQMRKGFTEVLDPRQAPGARHPIVRTHPITNKQALFLGRRRNGYIVGLSLEESEDTLDALWSHASQKQFVWAHQWRVGDLLVWDNRCLLHRRDSFDNSARRLMHRVQIRGERPI